MKIRTELPCAHGDVFSTRLSFGTARRFVSDVPVLCCNGALLRDDRRIYYQACLDESAVAAVYALCMEVGVEPFFITARGLYHLPLPPDDALLANAIERAIEHTNETVRFSFESEDEFDLFVSSGATLLIVCADVTGRGFDALRTGLQKLATEHPLPDPFTVEETDGFLIIRSARATEQNAASAYEAFEKEA